MRNPPSKQTNHQTKGQLERSLSQQFQKLYRDCLGHSTGKVSCRLFDDKVTIIIEDSLTQPEQLLMENSDPQRVKELHSDLSEIVRPQLVDLVENTLQQKVVDLMSDTTLETGRTGLVIVLSDYPQVAASGTSDTAQASSGKNENNSN
jgi:uncharacterized protein YbcI